MKFVLQILLALLIAIGASPTSAAVRVQAKAPCEHAVSVHHMGAVRDDCGRPSAAESGHGHCLVVSGGCCAFAQWPSAAAAPRLATIEIAWTIGTDRSLAGLSFAPATPPPRI